MNRKRKKQYSVFCEKSPMKENMGVGAVFVSADGSKNKIWTLVKGKIYKNGWFRYWHNGKEWKERPLRWHNLTGKPQDEIDGIIRKLNINTLSTIYPKHNKLYFVDLLDPSNDWQPTIR